MPIFCSLLLSFLASSNLGVAEAELTRKYGHASNANTMPSTTVIRASENTLESKNSKQTKSSYTDEDMEYFQKTFSKITFTYGHALDNLPPCERHRHTREAILENEPPRSCKMAREIYSEILQRGLFLEELCENFSDFMKQALQDKRGCYEPLPSSKLSVYEKLRRFRDLRDERMDLPPSSQELRNINWSQFEEIPESPSGEWKDIRCGIWPVIYTQFNQKELGLLNDTINFGDATIHNFCDEDESYKESFLEHLRYGEAGDPAKRKN